MLKKKTRILVEPISPTAKQRFDEMMNRLHICKIDHESETEFYLQSANQNYFFTIQKTNDPNWRIVK